jgi:ribosomal-protein-alanine N-acetyltransferase
VTPVAKVFAVRQISDLSALLRIEFASFSRPWTPAMFQQAFADPHTIVLAVRDTDDTIAGFVVGRVVADELEILIVAVDPDRRRQGMGQRLVLAILDLGREQGARAASLEVRRSNRAARRLYERLGFQREAVRQAYYQDPLEDGLIYWHRALSPS